MKITYDAEVDALTIRFGAGTVTTEHLADGIAADYDSDGKLVSIEILDAGKRCGDSETFQHVKFERYEVPVRHTR